MQPDNPPRISFIVPAHNEQAGIGRTLSAIHDSARELGQSYEIIVVNDASTDATAEIARQHNATVVPVKHRQIAATRNSGGRAASGQRFFFVDADTKVNPQAIASALRYMDAGAAGGGAPTLFEGEVPLYIRLVGFVGLGAKLVGFTGGAFMFCTREAFQATGGFDERLYWAEEGSFAMAMKRQGRFVVLWRPVLTSGRRFRTLSFLQLPVFLLRAIFSPFKAFTRRSFVEKIWYDSNRENDDKMPVSLSARTSNGIMLLLTVVLLTGPIWIFIPWSLTPRNTPLGEVRLVIGVFLCHVGLIFWPFAFLLTSNLLRHFVIGSMFWRKSWQEWLKLAALAAICFWQAWDSTLGVIWFWPWLFHRWVHI